MPRAALSSVVALAMAAMALPDQASFDCDKAYKSFAEKLNRRNSGNLSRERSAILRRWARRAYDACQTGDVGDPKALFERLERESY
jgi:hypothetical protein